MTDMEGLSILFPSIYLLYKIRAYLQNPVYEKDNNNIIQHMHVDSYILSTVR